MALVHGDGEPECTSGGWFKNSVQADFNHELVRRESGQQAISLWFQRVLQSFVPTNRAKPSLLSAGNGPLGLWAGLYAESRSRGTEEKGQSPQRLRGVDTPLAVDCGSCVIPFPGRIPIFVPEPSA
jgi:hypothetical protein